MKLTFLGHSCFAIEQDNRVFIFDYYQDEMGIVSHYLAGEKEVWFFVSHSHDDHFNPEIANAAKRASYYILHKDVPLSGVPEDKIIRMEPYEEVSVDGVKIKMYGSTDEGGSFYVDHNSRTLFFAGDLNWWHWLGDTDENNREAKMLYDREMDMLDGLCPDTALFPVDARLEDAREWGVLGFLEHVQVGKCLVPMHYCGPAWEPSLYFEAKFGDVPLWIPHRPGDEHRI